ncbi:BTB/POZ domain-containing protein, partial [Trifolium medium]|nr:BTB/POZ domain-containing protein [Trifolium medium]
MPVLMPPKMIALAGCVNTLHGESAPAAPARLSARGATTGEIVQRDGWVSVVRENQVLKVDMDRMSTRVGELEEEFSKIKKEMKTATKSHSARDS